MGAVACGEALHDLACKIFFYSDSSDLSSYSTVQVTVELYGTGRLTQLESLSTAAQLLARAVNRAANRAGRPAVTSKRGS